MLMKNWKVMLIVAIHCLIYFDDDLVFFSSAAADLNRTLADDRVAKGFISIDCGMSGDSRYDNNAGLHYTSDEDFINTGIKYNVQPQFDDPKWPVFNTLRSFPEGERNCYTLKPKQGKNCSYLIRVHFSYGNYDGKSSFPRFHLYIDVNFWGEVGQSASGYGFIYTPPRDYIHICLVNIGKGAPFISGLELKPLNTTTSIYKSTTGALGFYSRFDTGSTSTSDYYSRKDDPYDREWSGVPKSSAVWGSLRSDESMMKTTAIITEDAYKLPPSVLKTAAIPVHDDDTSSLDFYYNNISQNGVYQVYWHFVEIQKLRINDSREFTISLNGKSLPRKISPKYMEATTIVSPETTIDGNNPIVFNITRTPKSTLPPILNALEIYWVLNVSKLATNQDDVNAIMNIKKHYAMGKAWQGDPCRPAPVWNGLNCSEDDDNHSPRITSLNLVAKGLEGDIPGSLSNLTSLTHLNLSYNSLTGVIPDFLAYLPSLQTLDLKSNKFTGRVPTALSKKVEQGTLQLSLEDNPDLCTSSSCYKKNWKKIGAILAAALVSITLIVTAIAAVYKYKHKKQENSRGNVGFGINNNVEEEYELPIYDFYVVAQATNHFSKSNKVGEGGFGPVYKGVLSDGQEIAVKRLSKESRQGLNEFKNEVIFIAKLQHRNLVKLVGCSIEAEERLLIYEYMPNKSLDCYIFGTPSTL